MSQTARQARILASIDGEAPYLDPSNQALLDAVFYEQPVWRRHVAAHVKAWERHITRQAVSEFNKNQAFRAAYYQRGGQFLRSCA